MRALQCTSTQIVLIVAPPFLVLTTYFAFRHAAVWLGPERGYLVGFLFYWIFWCFLLPFLTVGVDGLRGMFQSPQPTFGTPNWLGVLLLLGPPLAMYITGFPGEVEKASLKIVLYSALFALANGTLEEILWRGAYISTFPKSWLWAYLYPAIWFGLWHLSPQVIYPSKMSGGPLAFALMSISLGLVWGWVAKTTGSIRWTVIAHILLNFAGLTGRWFVP